MVSVAFLVRYGKCKWILNKYRVRAWSGFNRLGIGTRGGFFKNGNGLSGFIMCGELLGLAEERVAFLKNGSASWG